MSNNQDISRHSRVRGQLFIIAAPSGGGKTSLVNELLRRDPRLVLSISHTTREPRPGEHEGQQYHFVSHASFREMVDRGEFLEHAQVFDYFYGTNENAVAQQLANGHDVILEIDWQGARQVRNKFPECCSIFILPPTLATLRSRLAKRGQDSEATILRRMQDAKTEISHWDEFSHLVVNDDFNDALKELNAIIDDQRQQRPRLVNREYQRLAQLLGRS